MAGVNIKQHDVNLENKILKLMLQSEDIIDITIENNIEENSFTYPLNQTIFNEIISMYKDYDLGGVSIGEETNLIYDNIKTGDRDEDKEILLHLNKIKSSKSDKKHINIYIKQLKDYTKIRGIVQATRNVTNYIKEAQENVDVEELTRIYDESYQDIYAEVICPAKSESTEDAVKATIKEIIEDSMKESKIKFNLDGIDDYGKILDGYLTYLLGDTGVGKTTVGCYLASACAKNGSKVLYVNLETKNTDCIKKLISANVSLDDYKIKYSHLINPVLLNEKDWDILEDIAVNDRLNEMGIYWLYNPGMSVEELKREIIKHVRMYDIDVVIGDYYQLLVKDGYEDALDSVVIPKISKDLMHMAGQYYINPEGKRKMISHVWLAQANKEIIYRQDKHPTKDDIYFGGQRDARLVLGVYRDEYYNEDTRKPGTIELGILKQNNGIANVWFDYIFENQHQIIRDMTEMEREQFNEDIDDEEY